MPSLPASSIREHFDAVASQRPTPRSLYERWERQQWSVNDVALGADSTEWSGAMRTSVRIHVENLINSFLIGEYTGLDLLGPIMTASPDEATLEFLGTQVADETRHNRLMMRLAAEVLGRSGEPKDMLAAAWSSLTPTHRELNLLESALVNDLQGNSADFDRWIRAVTLFHLITEGVLALRAQRLLISVLRRLSVLPGTKAGFIAMLRDEARHATFGLHAVRIGLAAGHEEAILDVLNSCLPLIMTIDVPTEDHMPSATELRTARQILAELHLRLRQIDVSPRVHEVVEQRGNSVLARMAKDDHL
jgi:ribonucleotide reductase beta subunit family protein with ferritin-like domain